MQRIIKIDFTSFFFLFNVATGQLIESGRCDSDPWLGPHFYGTALATSRGASHVGHPLSCLCPANAPRETAPHSVSPERAWGCWERGSSLDLDAGCMWLGLRGWLALCHLSTPRRVTTRHVDLVPAESRPRTQTDAHFLGFVLFLSKTLTWLVFHLWKKYLVGALAK